MTEKEMRKSLKELFAYTNTVVYPIETGYTTTGIPDLYIRTSRIVFWLELKICRSKKNVSIPFRPKQVDFILANRKFINAFVLLFWEHRDEYYLISDVRDSYASYDALCQASIWTGKNIDYSLSRLIESINSIVV